MPDTAALTPDRLTFAILAVPANRRVYAGEQTSYERLEGVVLVGVLQQQTDVLQARVQVRPYRVVTLALERLRHLQEVARRRCACARLPK